MSNQYIIYNVNAVIRGTGSLSEATVIFSLTRSTDVANMLRV